MGLKSFLQYLTEAPSKPYAIGIVTAQGAVLGQKLEPAESMLALHTNIWPAARNLSKHFRVSRHELMTDDYPSMDDYFAILDWCDREGYDIKTFRPTMHSLKVFDINRFDPRSLREEHLVEGKRRIKLYHGSPHEDLKTLKPNGNGVLFLSPALWAAEFHAEKYGKGAVYEVEISVDNPRVVGAMAYDNLTTDRKYIQGSQALGHDALVADDDLSYAVFKPVRVKKMLKKMKKDWKKEAEKGDQ